VSGLSFFRGLNFAEVETVAVRKHLRHHNCHGIARLAFASRISGSGDNFPILARRQIDEGGFRVLRQLLPQLRIIGGIGHREPIIVPKNISTLKVWRRLFFTEQIDNLSAWPRLAIPKRPSSSSDICSLA
jgi:hypothetical protein